MAQSLTLTDKYFTFQETLSAEVDAFSKVKDALSMVTQSSQHRPGWPDSQSLHYMSPLCMLCNITADITVSRVHNLPRVRTFSCVYHMFSLHVGSREVRCSFQSHFTEKEEAPSQVMQSAKGRLRI